MHVHHLYTSTRCHPATSYIQSATPRSAGTVTPGRAAQRLSWHLSCSLFSSQRHATCAPPQQQAVYEARTRRQGPHGHTWSHQKVGYTHTPASTCVVVEMGSTHGHDAREDTRAELNTHATFVINCHNNSNIVHGTPCTLIVLPPHAPKTYNSFNLGQVCRNTSGPVMPVPEACPTQHTHATDTPTQTPTE